MILLLLTSALALSFVPLTSNDLPEVEVTAPTFAPATKKLTVPIATKTAPGAGDLDGHTFRVGIFTVAEDGESLFSGEVTAAQLTTTPVSIIIDLVPYEKLVDLDKIYVDVLAKPTDAAEVSMLESGTRVAVSFAAKKATVTVEKVAATENVKISFTLTATLGTVTTTKFVLGAKDDITVTEDEAATFKYSVTILKADLLAADKPNGYFKGTDAATSTLPISLFADTPELELKHIDVTKAEANFANPPAAGSKIVLEGEVDPLSLTEGKCDLTYTQLASAKIYYTKEDGTPSSNKLDISLSPFPEPTMAWQIENGDDKTPKLKISFEDVDANRILVVAPTAVASAVALSAQVNVVEPAKLIGTAGYFITLNALVPQTLPRAFDEATFGQSKAAEDAGKIPVTVEMTAGFYEAKPTGLLVLEDEATDFTNAKYYAFTWGTTEPTKDKATADVTVADWADFTDVNVVSFVVGDYVAGPPKRAKVLSDSFIVIPKEGPTLPVITVGPATFAPATLKLTIPVKSDTNLTDAPYTIRLAGYTAGADGTELFTKDVKALLDGEGDHTVEFTLDMGEKFVGLKTIHIDVLAMSEEAEEEVSILPNEERVPVDFAAMKVSVAHTSTNTDVKFTFTLDADLEAGLANTKFVFNGAEETVTKEASPDHTYAVTITKAKLKAAPTTLGYFKGSNLATSTLPIWLFGSAPQFDIEHVDATTFKATPRAGTVPAGSDVWMKVGTAAAAKQTKVADKEYYLFNYEDMVDAVIYTADAAEIPTSNKPTITIPAFTAPEYEWVLVTEGADKTPKVKLVFEGANAKRKLIVPGTPDTVISLDTATKTFDLADLVKTGAYYIVYDAEKAPETRPLAIPAATLVQAKGAEATGKVPVTVTVEAGLLTAVPTGILVHAEGETNLTLAKYYALTWGTTAETVNKATAQVTVADFAELTAKNIESYVANKVGDAAPTKIAAAEKIVVIPKKEDPGKDEGAFGKMVSLMAVVVSLFVLAL